ncbi:UDP-3-O-acyl-N-acetylglucosamine deacetylase [Candidatus Pelagibacter communis]|uniref:UDP-3-O-acyl-N-acetylglucosamine deacetylase n=1 Tax=Pelagibacter ubique TaxID=198252 RepID=UPI00094DDCB2|nr:UDP-3-O-acyl-N-acetylglucosamine deacetylase [Candidatus Pelagibacter ubique]
MSILNQKTIKHSVEFNGVGLHSGKKVFMTLFPAPPNTGIIFRRSDLNSNNLVYPNVFNVSSASYCTKLTNEFGTTVSTVEHLMAALYGLGIDNLVVDLNSEELPIMDGSAKNFVETLEDVGFKISDLPIRIIKINKKVTYLDGEKFITFEPNKISLEIDFEIKYEQNSILNQRNKKNIYIDDLNDMYNSRTFCLFEDIEKLKKIGLAKGGSLDNAIVLKGNEILNSEKLRNPKEFVNHKILDCLGDIYLAGYRMVGKITSSQGGHNVTNQGLRELFSNNENFSIIELKEKNLPHSFLIKNPLKSSA